MHMQYKAWLGKQEFKRTVAPSTEPKIVVFAATWCGYCKRFLRMLDGFEPNKGKSSPEIVVVDADDEDESLWDEYGIRVVPTLVVLRNGKEEFKREARPGASLREMDVEDAIAAAGAS